MEISPTIVKESIQRKRDRFNQGLRERGFYATARYPGDVFIALEAGLKIEEIPRDDALGKTAYRAMAMDSFGNRLYDSTGDLLFIMKKYTPEQMMVIHQYWDLISEEAKIG